MRETIKAGGFLNIPLGEKWLNIFDFSHPFTVSSVRHNFSETIREIKPYDVEGVDLVTIRNPSKTHELVIEYDNSRFKTAADTAKVIDEVAIATDVPDIVLTKDDIDIPPLTKVVIADANPERHELMMQNISFNTTTLRVGSESVGNKHGLILTGNEQNPATMSLTAGGRVFVYNTSPTNTATVSALEVHQ